MSASESFVSIEIVDLVSQLELSDQTNVKSTLADITCNLLFFQTSDCMADVSEARLLLEMQNKTTQMRPNQSRVILVFLITPTTTRLFAGYSYTKGTQKAAKISNKNSFFNWVHSLHTELMNASHSTNLFTNSCDHISTNGKARLHSYKPQQPTILLFALTKG